MNRSISTLMVASLLMIVIGCNQPSPSGPEPVVNLKPESGKFGISHLGMTAKKTVAAAVKEGPDVEFDLGKIRGSTGFFFLLYNIGAVPITGVTLSVSKPGYAVFPTSMDTLIPGSDVGMLPIVKVSAFHGTPYDGVGTRPALPMGNNEFTLHIAGKSKTASGADTTISLDVNMDLEALVMDFTFATTKGAVDLNTTNAGISPEFNALPAAVGRTISGFSTVCKGDSVVTLTNTGNVPLRCNIHLKSNCSTLPCEITHLADTIVPPATSLLIDVALTSNEEKYLVIISGDNAVCKGDKFDLQGDGSYYASFVRGMGECATADVNKLYEDYLHEHGSTIGAKIWALLDNRVVFLGEYYQENDSLKYSMYDLVNDELLISYSGVDGASGNDMECKNETYCNDLKEMMMAANNPTEIKRLGLPQGRITSGGQNRWLDHLSSN